MKKYPTQIKFLALNRELSIIYTKTEHKRIKLLCTPTHITVLGDINDWAKVQKKLLLYIKEIALQHFEPWLFHLSEKVKLPIKSLRVRKMKTRWGSCDREGNICLNTELLFLPPPLAEHIMLHEICHTKYMSHGPRFWGLLARVDPHCDKHKKWLREIEKQIHYNFKLAEISRLTY